ncbi:hypothetical protein [Microbacterium ulmi]|uniref:Uncharacterized protein n=1 Tax=Microbacterium ulmi TaxID=179095 RepID=A0A7Y2M1G4_9MICO|nr:hypothetical protein [Microbacterium ulmi]NII69454.1 hypothetical protein [Microbacterium ulmi]NNH04412.1 hypothetical protein [Microbacterium ulmi]
MREISRRMAFAYIAGSAAGLLAACSSPERPEAGRSSPTPTPTATDATAGVPTSLGGAQEIGAAAAFGPTGAHWPTRTPRGTDAFDVVAEAECSWPDIRRAIAFVDEKARGGTGVVLVRPGTLPGSGAGSSSRPVLEVVGSAGRAHRILVAPRDGVGTVAFGESIRIDRVLGVAFVGFWTYPYSVALTGVQDFAWAWSKGQAFNVTSGRTGEANDVELVECVTPDALVTDSDAWAFRAAGNAYSGIQVVGCYIAPSYKPAGSQAHCDTLQLSGDRPQARITLTDTALFASTNAGFIPSGLASEVLFDHSLLVGGDRMLQRYALPAGANAFTSGYPAAVNGSGTTGVLSARDSLFIGGVKGAWATVENSSVSDRAGTVAASGGFRSDPSLASIDAAWLERMAPTPTDDRLRAIWGA